MKRMICPNKLICGYRWRGALWIRFCGIGFSIQDRTIWNPLFSERYGFRWGFQIGKYRVNLLVVV